MCDCIEKGTERLKNHIAESLKESDSGFIEIVKAEYKNRAFIFGKSSVSSPISMPFAVTYRRELKNGKIKEKKTETSILPSFCPFCGEKIKKEGEP